MLSNFRSIAEQCLIKQSKQKRCKTQKGGNDGSMDSKKKLKLVPRAAPPNGRQLKFKKHTGKYVGTLKQIGFSPYFHGQEKFCEENF